MMENQNYEGMILSQASPFAISEAFKMLRTNMFYTSGGEACPVYGITSSFAHSGKSVIISNLAVSFAQLDKKVLILDCDLRNSVVHKILGVDRAGGMSELLAGGDNSLDKYVKKTKYPNLSVITAGGTPPNPAELLCGERMRKFVGFMKQHYDVIFIDLPPASVVSDAAALADCVTGYIFAVRSGFDDKKSVRYSLSLLEQTHANIIGFVLNDVNPKSGSYYGKYSYGYASRGYHKKP